MKNEYVEVDGPIRPPQDALLDRLGIYVGTFHNVITDTTISVWHYREGEYWIERNRPTIDGEKSFCFPIENATDLLADAIALRQARLGRLAEGKLVAGMLEER